jgi:hypothetical protein
MTEGVSRQGSVVTATNTAFDAFSPNRSLAAFTFMVT